MRVRACVQAVAALRRAPSEISELERVGLSYELAQHSDAGAAHRRSCGTAGTGGMLVQSSAVHGSAWGYLWHRRSHI